MQMLTGVTRVRRGGRQGKQKKRRNNKNISEGLTRRHTWVGPAVEREGLQGRVGGEGGLQGADVLRVNGPDLPVHHRGVRTGSHPLSFETGVGARHQPGHAYNEVGREGLGFYNSLRKNHLSHTHALRGSQRSHPRPVVTNNPTHRH
jgi:hypothetical protein